jgi:hypothetical protein
MLEECISSFYFDKHFFKKFRDSILLRNFCNFLFEVHHKSLFAFEIFCKPLLEPFHIYKVMENTHGRNMRLHLFHQEAYEWFPSLRSFFKRPQSY